MLGRGHALSGAVGYLAAAPVVLPGIGGLELAAGTLLCAGAALAPDLDHPGSTVSRSAGPASQVAAAGVRAVSGGHRMGTHSLFFSAISAVAAWWLAYVASTALAAAVVAGFLVAVAGPLLGRSFGMRVTATTGVAAGVGLGYAINDGHLALGAWYALAVPLGVFLHAMGDLLTPQGVPLGYPFTRARAKLPLFTTGSPVEGAVTGVLAVAGVYLGVLAVA